MGKASSKRQPATDEPVKKSGKVKRKKSSKLTQGLISITRDPRVYAAQLPQKPPEYRRICGLDFGTNCGIAHADIVPGNPVLQTPLILGQWDLSVGKYDSGALRHIRLKAFLAVLEPDLILFEDVKFVPANDSFKGPARFNLAAICARVTPTAEFLGGLKTTVTTWAEERGIPYQGLAITEIKQFATGKGNASKVQMIEAANEQFHMTLDPEAADETGAHNMVDAAFVCAMGLQTYKDAL